MNLNSLENGGDVMVDVECLFIYDVCQTDSSELVLGTTKQNFVYVSVVN